MMKFDEVCMMICLWLETKFELLLDTPSEMASTRLLSDLQYSKLQIYVYNEKFE